MENSLYGGLYNPDILMCLANLSSDEVFTPPEIANQMLDMLPQELFKDPNTKFLDPACKSGVFLREIVKRLNEGLKDLMPDTQARLDHILHNQVYGTAITELTSLLSRRSLYCSKYPNSVFSISHFDSVEGNVRYKKTQHRWKNGSCVFCGASQAQYERDKALETHAYEFIHTTKPEEILKMKFDVIICNPPYQLGTGSGGGHALPIYQKFVMQAKKLKPRYMSMVIPARWYSGGIGLSDFRNNMFSDNCLRKIVDYPNAADCFSGVEIKGGVCYFLWERDNPGQCSVTTINGNSVGTSLERPLLESGNDTFIRYNEAINIYRKVASYDEESISQGVSSSNPFGIRTVEKSKKTKPDKGDIIIYQNGGTGYIPKKNIKLNQGLVDKWKVLVSEAYNAGDNYPHQIIGKPILAPPNSCCTGTYIVVMAFDSEQEAINFISYLQTRFFRFLVMLKKISQHSTSKVYQFVPKQDFKKSWTDKELYKRYKITKDEIDFIESMIKPMGGDENAE